MKPFYVVMHITTGVVTYRGTKQYKALERLNPGYTYGVSWEGDPEAATVQAMNRREDHLRHGYKGATGIRDRKAQGRCRQPSSRVA